MRLTALALSLAAMLPAAAYGHTLDGETSLLAQLSHQIAAWHHLPLLTIVLLIAIVAVRQRRRTGGTANRLRDISDD